MDITMIRNDKNVSVPTRFQFGWCVYVDHRKLNATTRIDHFSIPFLGQMLDRLAGHSFVAF